MQPGHLGCVISQDPHFTNITKWFCKIPIEKTYIAVSHGAVYLPSEKSAGMVEWSMMHPSQTLHTNNGFTHSILF